MSKKHTEPPRLSEENDARRIERRELVKKGLIATGGVAAIASLHTPVEGCPQTECEWLRAGWLNVKDYGAVGDGVHNDTPHIQSALDDANGENNEPGKVVFFPPGNYRIEETLVAQECSIIGAGMHDPYNHVGSGSVLCGCLTETQSPLLRIGGGTNIEGMVFFYPDQMKEEADDTPIQYGYTIYSDPNLDNRRMGVRIYHNYFINCYKICYLPTSFSEFVHNKCCALKEGINIDYCECFQLIADNIFSYTIWRKATTNAKNWIAENCNGLILHDNFSTVSGNFFFGMDTAVNVFGNWSEAKFVNNAIDGCRFGLVFQNGSQAWRLPITGNTFQIRRQTDDGVFSHAIWVKNTSEKVDLQVCGNHIGGVNGDCIKVDTEGTTTNGVCNLICSGNEFFEPGRFLTTSYARYAVSFDSPFGKLVFVGNSVVGGVSYQYGGGIRVYQAKVVCISNNTFQDLTYMAVKIDAAISATVLGNISIGQQGASYLASGVTNIEDKHNIWSP